MKVTQVLYSGKGGHGSVAHSLIRADKDKIFEHQLIYYGIESADSDYLDFCKSQNIDFSAIHKPEGKHLNSWRNYLKALRNQRPDRIVLHSMTLILPTIWYCFSHKSKLVAVEHQSNQFKRKSEWWWSFLALIFAKRVVYLTEFYRDEILSKFGFSQKMKKISVISNGIDTNYFVPGKPLSSEKIKIGMASRINSLRDHGTLIFVYDTLVKMYPNIELHIAGDGEGMEKLRNDVNLSAHKQSIFLHGNLNESQLLLFLQDLDIYVHSTWAETMSTSILQAMSVGLPIIATRIPSNMNLFSEGKEGFFFKVEDADELIEKIKPLLDDELLRKRMGKSARQKSVADYSATDMFADYTRLLQSL